MDAHFWEALEKTLIQKGIKELFELNNIDEDAFAKLTMKDLSDVLCIKFYSDRMKLLDAQKMLKNKARGPGQGNLFKGGLTLQKVS
ncbi:hypothetical protein AC249_AIPGENE24666 [Exaiptasia diaphana]|nr:hypothetical protein AC249_AIPGENE24666 [Exaiptasia diaphana]